MNQTESWIFNQSGVIPYRCREGEVEVLLITSRKRKRWVIPKGIVEAPLSPKDSAAKEAWEEAGITGHVSQSAIGNFQYDKWGGTCHVEVYLFRVDSVLADWPEVWRSRQWFSLEEAANLVDELQLKQIITTIPSLI